MSEPLSHNHPVNRISRFTLLTLVAIVALAFFLRSWQIDSLPAGLYPDEAVNGIDAIRANETHVYHTFYPNNNGREGLFINLQALALRIFGLHIWSLKLFSVLFGTLTVWGVYLLAFELWRKRPIALVSAFLVATSYWAINFSRIGFRAIMVPFILSFAFYFFFRGLRTKTLSPFFLSGLIFGAGLNTYIAFRVAPLIGIILLAGLALSFRDFFRLWYKHLLVFVLGALLTALPMFLDFAHHPEHFSSRSASISILSPEVNHGHLWLTLSKTLGLSLTKYSFWGDQNWRHNYAPYPNLDPFAGTLFLIGFCFLIARTLHLFIRRVRTGERERELAVDLFLLGWFFTMLIPEFLTDEGLPHSLRSIGTLLVAFLIATVPFLWIDEWYRRAGTSLRLALAFTLGILFLTIGLWNGIKYFVFFNGNINQHGAFNQNFTNMAAYLNNLPTDTPKYVYANAGGTMIDNDLPVTAQPIVFLTHHRPGAPVFLVPDDMNPDGKPLRASAVIIPMNWDDGFFERIKTTHPTATTEKIDLHPGTGSDFTIIHL